AAQLEVADERVLRSVGHEVGDEAVPDVLVGVGALRRAVILVLRSGDKSGKRAVVQSSGESVIGIEAKVVDKALRGGKRDAVIDAIAAVVQEIFKTCRIQGTAESSLFALQTRERNGVVWRDGKDAGIGAC